MGNLEKREKILLVLLGIMLVIYVYFRFFLNPINAQLKVKSENINNKQIQVAAIEQTKIQNANNIKSLEEMKAKFNIAVKALPKNEKNPEISYNFKGIADQCNVSIQQVTFGQISEYIDKTKEGTKTAASTKSATKDGVQKLIVVPVNTIINGEYAAIVKYMELIESGNRIAEIDNINITCKDKAVNQVEAKINVKYYYSYTDKVEDPTYDFQDPNAGKENLFN